MAALRIETIDELAEILSASTLTKVELEHDTWSVTLERDGVARAASRPEHAAAPAPVAAPAAVPHVYVQAQVVGVFHEATAAAMHGQVVKAGDLLGTIDALTIRNDVRAPEDGEIATVQVEDGQPVEYGQVLFSLVRPGGA